MGIAVILSSFMNNIGAMAMLLPVTLGICQKMSWSPSKFLMPLAFASILGGMNTKIGTPPNIIISEFRDQYSDEGFEFFDFAYAGLPVSIGGVIFIALLGFILVKNRSGENDASSLVDINEYLVELVIEKDSELIGKRTQEFRKELGSDIVLIGSVNESSDAREILSNFDELKESQILLIKVSPEEVSGIQEKYGLTLRTEIKDLDEELGQRIPWNLIIIGIVVVVIVIGIGAYLYFQRKEMDELKREAEEKVGSLKNEFEDKLKTTSDQIKSVSRTAVRSQQSTANLGASEPIQEQPKTKEEIIAEKYDELVSDYKEALEDFSKVAGFKQKWHGLALSRKERQDGTKTILINSSRAFEKAEIWCVTFSEKYFAFPGSTVKSNMATYMNLDFEKAGRDFKGVFAVSSGSNYLTEPSVLRRGGSWICS